MNIVVCLKEVRNPLDMTSEMVVSETSELDTSKLGIIMNPYDELAVEEALRIKEKGDAKKVTLISLRPETAEKVLRKGLAMGADEAMRIWDDGCIGYDTPGLARILGRIVERVGFDLILCGYRTIDNGSSELPAMLAEALSIPFVGGVVGIEVQATKKECIVWRKLERGDREKIRCPLPAVFSMEAGPHNARYPTLPRTLKSLRSEINHPSLKDMNPELEGLGEKAGGRRIEGYSPPRPKTKKFFVPDSNLSATERLRLLMSGGLQEKSGDTLEGEPGKVAAQMIRFLVDESVISRDEKGA